VKIAASVAALAQPGEIVVTRTVKDLLVGSGISLTDRGRHSLSEIPDEWSPFAVSSSC
jgi:hypothetical protein